MADPRFYRPLGPLGLDTLANLVGAELVRWGTRTSHVATLASLDAAGPEALAFVETRRFVSAAEQSGAGALLIVGEFAKRIGDDVAVLATPSPALAFAAAAAHLVAPIGEVWPSADERPVSREARIDTDVKLGWGAVVGAGAEIGAGTEIAPGAKIGAGVTIGRNCFIGPDAHVVYSHLGDRVTVKSGASLGSSGFGFHPGPQGLVKMPQIGRLIVQDDVEIGANTAIDRGSLGDTEIGEGTKIDNLVQIGHNCRIGRCCVLAGQVGLAGSTIVEDFVQLGGQVGVNGHLTIGRGAQAAAQTGIAGDVPAGAQIGGTPARPIMQWKRESVLLRRLVTRRQPGEAEGKD